MKEVWLKSCSVVVLPEENNSYRLLARGTGRSFLLNSVEAKAWFEGNVNNMGKVTDELKEAGLVYKAKRKASLPSLLDDFIPVPARRWLRFYSESPELAVLFNTKSMPGNNPLLVLGPYGSVVWRAIINGESIGRIRNRVIRLFGEDEVFPFLARLMHLGFLIQQEQILNASSEEQKVIKEFHTPEIQFMLHHSRIPWYCIWEITTICDTRCQICYLKDYQTQGPLGIELDDLIKQIEQMGIFYITLLGGEAMMRSDLEDVIARLRKSNIFVKLITDGNLLTPERAGNLAHAGLNHIEISFDGLTANSHEKSRAKGTFQKAEQAVFTAQENFIPRVGMVFTLHSQNVDDLPDLPVFMKRHKIHECYISLFHKTGLLGGNSNITPLSVEMLPKIHKQIQQWKTEHADLTITLLSLCTCGHTSVVIGADMTLRPCTFSYASAIGNLRQNSLQELWDRMGERPRVDTIWCQIP
ncbi:MAG: radical SAM protein [Chloroflexi bacterium]|nr:radical SAM protein [Chloroflexota bacterium]